jgi:hypothetical protein
MGISRYREGEETVLESQTRDWYHKDFLTLSWWGATQLRSFLPTSSLFSLQVVIHTMTNALSKQWSFISRAMNILSL